MPSKMVVRRQRNATAVEAAVIAHASEAHEAVEDALGSFLEDGEAFPDLELLQQLCRRSLEAHQRQLVQRDEEHLARLRNGVDPLQRRKAAARALGRSLAQFRETTRGIFGRPAADALFGLGGPMGQDPEELIRKGRRMLGVLARGDLQLPEPILRGISVDTSAWSEDLRPLLEELEASHDAVTRQRRQEESTLVAKHQAFDRHDRAYRRVVKMLQGLYELGDLTALAERVRPSPARRSQERASPSPRSDVPRVDGASEDRPTGPEAIFEASPAPPALGLFPAA